MKSFKIALIGAGVWGKIHALLFTQHPAVDLVAVCDVDPAKARALAVESGLSPDYAFSDHRVMLDTVACDAVSIVTPDTLHRQLAVDCAERKKHILLEKPLATTKEDVYAITEAVRQNKVRIMVDLHNRWSPPVAVVREAIQNGEIGQVSCGYYRLNDIKWVATDMLAWSGDSSILWFLGSHSLDTLRWLFDDEVDTVYALSNSGILSKQGIDTVDVYQTLIRFQKGGIATMENGWITPNGHPCINDIKCNIVGSKGMFSLDLSNSQMIERYTDERCDRPDVLVKHSVHGRLKGFAYESINSFVDKLASDEPFIVSLEDAANTSLAILGILESARTGKVVKVDHVQAG